MDFDVGHGVPLLENVVLCGVVADAAVEAQGVRIDYHGVHIDVQLGGPDVEGCGQGHAVV